MCATVCKSQKTGIAVICTDRILLAATTIHLCTRELLASPYMYCNLYAICLDTYIFSYIPVYFLLGHDFIYVCMLKSERD